MQHNPEKVSAALKMIRTGHSVRHAAFFYGVPASTLRDKFRLSHPRSRPGAPTVLNEKVEDYAVAWVLDMAKAGFPVSTRTLRASVAYYVKKRGVPNTFKDGVPGKKWTRLFLRRHPSISRRVPSLLPKYRAVVTEGQIRSWFAEITKYIESEGHHQILQDPSRIFNMDETAVSTVPTKEVVLAGVGSRYVHARVGNSDKESYTALFGASASGVLVPPLMIFPYKQRIPRDIFQMLPEGWAAGRTQSGWMNRDTFYEYLRDVFVPWLQNQEAELPVILFVDGHKSHVSHLSMEVCKKSGIILICLPANTTQITQPLDVCFFRPLKEYWNQILVDWRIDHRGGQLPKCEIAPLLKKAVDKMDNLTSTLVNGFKRCGLFPFDPESVNYSSLTSENSAVPEPSPVEVESLVTQSDGGIRESTMEYFESYLSPQQMKCFKDNLKMRNWTGPTEDTGLFAVWKRMRDNNCGSSDNAIIEAAGHLSEEEEPLFLGFPEAAHTLDMVDYQGKTKVLKFFK